MTARRILLAGVGLALGGAAAGASAAEYEVRVQNLTRGIHFTPLLIAAHESGTSVFAVGESASVSLQAMAEGGDIEPLSMDLSALGATLSENPAGGLLGPGDATTAMLDTDSAAANTRLSVVAMMLPTNDGFVGLDAVPLPGAGDTRTWDLYAHDAGTEANDEVRGSGEPGVAGFPVPPPLDGEVGTGGSGRTASAEGHVHIHRGVLGDTSDTGGVSDVDSTRHRWLNPVARITVTAE